MSERETVTILDLHCTQKHWRGANYECTVENDSGLSMLLVAVSPRAKGGD